MDGKLTASGILTLQWEQGVHVSKRILIANRVEIAVRIRAALIAMVAVYSTAVEALHTLLADEAVCIGPGKGRVLSQY